MFHVQFMSVENLGYRKLCATWALKMLTYVYNQKRLAAVTTILHWYWNDGDKLFHYSETGDKTWISYWNAETKQQSVQWYIHHPHGPRSFSKNVQTESF